MATVTKSGGTVSKIARAGTVKTATVDFPAGDPPPPPATSVSFDCSGEDFDDFRNALNHELKVDVTYDDTTNVPAMVRQHR